MFGCLLQCVMKEIIFFSSLVASGRFGAAMCAEQMMVEYFKQWPGVSMYVQQASLAQRGLIFMANISAHVPLGQSIWMNNSLHYGAYMLECILGHGFAYL